MEVERWQKEGDTVMEQEFRCCASTSPDCGIGSCVEGGSGCAIKRLYVLYTMIGRRDTAQNLRHKKLSFTS